MLSPEGYLAEKARTGKILVSVGVDFPQLANQPYLVVTAKMPLDEKKKSALIVIRHTARKLLQRPAEAARYFRRVKLPSSGIAEDGKIDPEGRMRSNPRMWGSISARSSIPKRRTTNYGPIASSLQLKESKIPQPITRSARNARPDRRGIPGGSGERR